VRFLRALVTVLTSVMIVGFILLIVLLVTRFPDASAFVLPERINLPENVGAIAFTQADGWYAIVTDADQILIFDRADGTLVRSVDIVLPER